MAQVIYRFVPLARSDFPRLRAWLAMPHVARWWHDPDAEIELIRAHFERRDLDQYVVHAGELPLGYLQCYDPTVEVDDLYGAQPPGTRGIDQFIGEADLIDRGHGSAFIRAFVDDLLAAGTPRVLTDPEPANARAVRAYEKAGFAHERLVDTPLGRLLLMARSA